MFIVKEELLLKAQIDNVYKKYKLSSLVLKVY